MNRIILIEDVQKFAEHFTVEAKSKAIEVAHKRSFEGLTEILPKHHTKYAAVVLDIKCLIKEDQPKEDSRFIGTAMTYLDKNIPNFPRFILTGDELEFNKLKSIFAEEKIFLKNPQGLKDLFSEVETCIANSEYLLVKRLNSQVFQMFDKGLLPDSAEKLLVKIVQEGLSETNPENFKGILANIRSFQETLFKHLNNKNKSVVPDNMLRPSNGMINFSNLMHHLSGCPDNKYVPTKTVYQNKTIRYLHEALYWSCGEYIHEDLKRKYMISQFALRSHVYNLLELTVWSAQYL